MGKWKPSNEPEIIFFDSEYNVCSESEAKIKVESQKVFSFQKLSYNIFYERDTEGKWHQIGVEDIPLQCYKATATFSKCSWGKEYKELTTKISLSIIFDERMAKATKGINKYTSIPKWGIKINKGIDWSFRIHNKNLSKLQQAWEDTFGQGTFEIHRPDLSKLEDWVNEKQADLDLVNQLYTSSKLALADLDEEKLKTIEENNHKVISISTSSYKFEEEVKQIEVINDAIQMVKANALFQQFKTIISKISTIQDNHQQLREKAIKLLTLKLQGVEVPTGTSTTEERQKGIDAIVNLNAQLLQFIHKIVTTNKTCAKTVYKLYKSSNIKLLDETVKKMEEVINGNCK